MVTNVVSGLPSGPSTRNSNGAATPARNRVVDGTSVYPPALTARPPTSAPGAAWVCPPAVAAAGALSGPVARPMAYPRTRARTSASMAAPARRPARSERSGIRTGQRVSGLVDRGAHLVQRQQPVAADRDRAGRQVYLDV